VKNARRRAAARAFSGSLVCRLCVCVRRRAAVADASRRRVAPQACPTSSWCWWATAERVRARAASRAPAAGARANGPTRSLGLQQRPWASTPCAAPPPRAAAAAPPWRPDRARTAVISPARSPARADRARSARHAARKRHAQQRTLPCPWFVAAHAALLTPPVFSGPRFQARRRS
jgi:hypothetical protein